MGEDQTRVSKLRLGRTVDINEGMKEQERKYGQVGLLLRKTTLGFTAKDYEGTGSVIITNRRIFEGWSWGALKKICEIDPLKRGDWRGC